MLKSSLSFFENRLKQGTEKPSGTSRYSLNFDESTSSAPSRPT